MGCGSGSFYYPWGVAVNKHRKLAVCYTKNARAQLFRMDCVSLGVMIQSNSNIFRQNTPMEILNVESDD